MKLPVQTVILLVLAVLATILVMRSCRPAPENPSDGKVKELLSRVSSDSLKLLQKDSVIERLLTRRSVDSVKSEARYRRSVAKIQGWENKANALELQLASKIDSIPEIDSLLTLKNEVIAGLKHENDSLHADLVTERESFQEFRQEVHTKERISQRLTGEQAQIITLLETDNQKLRKKVRNEKRLTAAVGILAFILGVIAAK